MRQVRAIRIKKERIKMKKTLLVLGLALSLVFAFAVTAMAATMLTDPAHLPGDGTSDYASPATPILPTDYVTGTSRIHSRYTQNTNACASCHSVHTAVGEMLLQWEDDQATCEACHNGTLGRQTYDVFDGRIGTGNTAIQAWGGAFDSTVGISSSMHNTGGGIVSIGGAPGGDTHNASNLASKWGKEFTCTSCHDPHGTAGNGRILNPTVNDANYKTGSTPKNLTAITSGGSVLYYVARLPILTGDQKDSSTSDTTLWDPDLKPGEYAKLLTGHGTDPVIYSGTSKPAFTLDNTGDFTKITITGAFVTPPTATYTAALRVKLMVNNYMQDNEKVTYIKGMNDFCGACHTDYNTANFNKKQAVVSSSNPAKLTDQGSPYYVKTSLKDANNNSLSTYNVLNGSYHEAYRHAVGRFSGNATQIGQGLQFEQIRLTNATTGVQEATDRFVFVCTTCHISHGASQTVWQNFKNQKDPVTNVNYKGILDPGIRFDGAESSTNSRIKRMPNMGSCETCHNKGGGNQGMPY